MTSWCSHSGFGPPSYGIRVHTEDLCSLTKRQSALNIAADFSKAWHRRRPYNRFMRSRRSAIVKLRVRGTGGSGVESSLHPSIKALSHCGDVYRRPPYQVAASLIVFPFGARTPQILALQDAEIEC
jgi:hypothetical protein